MQQVFLIIRTFTYLHFKMLNAAKTKQFKQVNEVIAGNKCLVKSIQTCFPLENYYLCTEARIFLTTFIWSNDPDREQLNLNTGRRCEVWKDDRNESSTGFTVNLRDILSGGRRISDQIRQQMM